MNNTQWSKCERCGKDEKFVIHLVKGDRTIEIRVCGKQCTLSKKEKECL